MKFQRTGDGPAVVLIPGLACDSRLWAAVASRLEDRFALIVPETWHCSSLSEAADGVAGVVTETGTAPAGVAGLSMGGYITFELLRRWPQKIRAAVLLDSTPYPDPPDRAEKRQQVLRLIGEGGFEPVIASFAKSVLSPLNADRSPARSLLLTMAREMGTEVYAQCVRAILERGSYEDVLRTVRVPLLFLAGEYDALTPPDVARVAAAQVPGARMEVVPGAGHMTPLEAPEVVAQLLGDFFGRLLPAKT
jgi:pimeloyl-ACP methyl ester carboxylesterase